MSKHFDDHHSYYGMVQQRRLWCDRYWNVCLVHVYV